MLPHALRFPLWVVFAVAGLFAWRYAGLHHGWYQPPRILRIVLALLLAAAVFKEFGTLLGRDAGMAMLAGLTGLKFLEARSLRDYMLTVFLLYLLIAGDFLYSQSLAHGAYMILAATLCTATMVRLNLRQTRTPRFSLGLAGGMMLKALPLMLIIYLFFPRIQGGLWGLPADAYSGLTGLSERMSPGSINLLSQSTEPAFRVEFEGARPANRDLYWRAIVMWDTDGREWEPGNPLPLESGPTQLAGDINRYTITLEPHNKYWLVALDRPASIPSGARQLSGYLLRHRSRVYKRLRYDLVSRAISRPNSLSPVIRQRALALPPGLSGRVRSLAQKWRRRAQTDRDVAHAALKYFHDEEFIYTLQPPLLGADPVDEFLFSTRRGFCEHYAAAFVTLMRAAGVPARVVTGFQGGEYNPTGNYMIVRQSDAHAWAEVWLAGKGWVRMDPTAAIAPERVEFGIDAVRRLRSQGLPLGGLAPDILMRAIQLDFFANAWNRSRLLWDAVNLEWYRWVADYDWARQERLLNALGFYAPTWLGMFAGLAGAVVVIVFALAWFMRLRRGPVDPVLVAYLKFCRKLEKAGLQRRPAEGPKDFAQRSMQKLPAAEEQIQTITALYTKLRYGDGPNELLDEMKKKIWEFKLQGVRVG